MPKFTFKCEHLNCYTDEVESTNTIEFNKECLYDVIEEFERFLKGAGFVFDGQLDIVKNDFSELDFETSDDDISIKLDDFDVSSSTAWPFPENERP